MQRVPACRFVSTFPALIAGARGDVSPEDILALTVKLVEAGIRHFGRSSMSAMRPRTRAGRPHRHDVAARLANRARGPVAFVVHPSRKGYVGRASG
jgi:hypothetical protein